VVVWVGGGFVFFFWGGGGGGGFFVFLLCLIVAVSPAPIERVGVDLTGVCWRGKLILFLLIWGYV